jgi:hypothetical protein
MIQMAFLNQSLLASRSMTPSRMSPDQARRIRAAESRDRLALVSSRRSLLRHGVTVVGGTIAGPAILTSAAPSSEPAFVDHGQAPVHNPFVTFTFAGLSGTGAAGSSTAPGYLESVG